MSADLDGIDRATVERLKRWACMRCGTRLLAYADGVATEMIARCPKCRKITFNCLRIVVVEKSQSGEQNGA